MLIARAHVCLPVSVCGGVIGTSGDVATAPPVRSGVGPRGVEEEEALLV